MSKVATRRVVRKKRTTRKYGIPAKAKRQYNKRGYKSYARKEYEEREPGFISAGGSALGAAIGTGLGGPAGTAIGSFLGGKLGHLVETITGFGDYTIEQNSIMKGGMSPPVVMNSINKGGVIIRHREYIQDILPTNEFEARVFYLNPGNSDTFPWLSRAASLFDQYRFRGVLFEFKSTSSDAILSASTSSALGSVSMATDYDVLDVTYSSKREMLNSMFANSTKPSCNLIHPIECKSSLSPMRLQYVRTTNGYPAGGDPRMYDLGKTIFATEGQQNVSVSSGAIGELWITYEVELFKQQLGADIAKTDHFKITGATAPTWLATGATNHPGDPENSIGGVINVAGNAYTFPSTISNGKYKIDYFCLGTAATVGEILLTLTNCSAVDLWTAASPFVQSPASGVSSVAYMASFVIQITGPAAVIEFGNVNIPTAGEGDFWVCQIDNDLTDF